MKSVPFIDISKTNCWLVNLLPFSDKSNKDAIMEIQSQCIKNSIFGMGWDCLHTNIIEFVELDDTEHKKHLDRCKHCEYSCKVSDKTLSYYKEIQPGDYVITRLKNAHYYIGKVETKAFHSYGQEKVEKISWCCRVEKWIEFDNESMIPSEILGRFSQRNHSTIEKIANYRTKLLVISTYEKRLLEKDRIFNVPQLHITPNNFCRCLNYTELEDLVYLYILKKHKDEGYICFPSSGKINRAKVEFSFINFNSDKKPITCQVKNQETIDIENYLNEPTYSLIYLFSGKWEEKDIKELQDKYSDTNIIFISPTELYELINEYLAYANKSEYSVGDNEENKFYNSLESLGFKSIKKSFYYQNKELNKTQIKIEDNADTVYFSSYNLFYSKEFEALVLNGNVDKAIVEYVKSKIC